MDAHEAFIIDLIDAQKDITLNEMVVRLHDKRDILVSRSGLNVRLRKRGFTYKKDRTCTGAGASRRLKRCQDWFDAQLGLDLTKLVFIDETGLNI